MQISAAEFIRWYNAHFPQDNWEWCRSKIEAYNALTGQWALSHDVMYDTDDLGRVVYVGNDPSLQGAWSTVTNHIYEWRRGVDPFVIDMDFICRKCNSQDIEYRETYNGHGTTESYECVSCGHVRSIYYADN